MEMAKRQTKKARVPYEGEETDGKGIRSKFGEGGEV